MSMNISSNTINALKNFSAINKSIVIKPGNEISTLAVTKNILASMQTQETFDSQVSIYDLGEFLGVIGLFKNPDFDFSNNGYCLIKETGSRTRTKYFYADPSVITSPPEKKVEMPSVDVEFDITDGQLIALQRAAVVYRVEDLSVVGDGEVIELVVRDRKNDTSNVFSVQVGETDAEFCFNLKVENLKLLPGDYQVQMSKSNVSLFTNRLNGVEYFIACEPDSSYEG